MGDAALVRVSVLYSPGPRRVLEWAVSLPPGAVVLDALQASGLPGQAYQPDGAPATVGIWGRRVGLQEPLGEGDRIEVLRPLQVDPKVARRERFRMQGARSAGLFARRSRGLGPASR